MLDQSGKVLRSNSLNRTTLTNLVTINTLKQRRIQGNPLSEGELTALTNFEHYSTQMLENAENEAEYEKKFREITSLSNLTNYEEFLKEKYSNNSI